MLRFWPSLALGIVAVLVAHLSHGELAAGRTSVGRSDDSPPLFLPSSTSLKLLAFGQDVTLADAYWLRFVQYVGDPRVQAAGVPQALELANLITDLDPLYGYAYQSAGIVLNGARRLDDSDAILEKGMEHVPGRWQLPFYLAFNHWYERGDLLMGAELLRRAAAHPDAPRYVAGLVARLASAADRNDAAQQYLEELLRTANEPGLRALIEERLVDVQIDIDLRWLDDAIARYRLETGLRPGTLDDLVGRRLVALPVSPAGTGYRYDWFLGQALPPEGKRLGRRVKTATDR